MAKMSKRRGEVRAFKSKKNNRITGKAGLIAAELIILVIAYFVMSGFKIIKLNQEKEEAEARKQELINRKEELMAEYENINSAQCIERLARRDLKLVKSDELLFILPDDTLKEKDNDQGEAEN